MTGWTAPGRGGPDRLWAQQFPGEGRGGAHSVLTLSPLNHMPHLIRKCGAEVQDRGDEFRQTPPPPRTSGEGGPASRQLLGWDWFGPLLVC